MWRSTLLVCAVLFFFCSAAAGQALTAEKESRIDRVFEGFAKSESPGCALGVYRNGAVAYARGYGIASLELSVPITPQTVFDIGSTSKQFTAFAVLQLQQQGKLSVDDDIRKFIPELPEYGHRITLRHLLTHTSGLRDYTALFELAGVPEQNLTTDADALRLLVRQKGTNFEPGSEWDYSNSGFFLLSQVVKRVAGKTLREFSAENIFRPLAMNNTQIFDNHTLIIKGRATGYSYDPERKAFGVEMSNFEQAGDGSVQTSVTDLLRWDENFYTAKLGGSALLEEIQIPGKLNNGESHGYADGLFISTYRGQPIVSHGGAWAGYRAELLRFPRQHTSVAVLCNVAQARPSRLARAVADIVVASSLEPETTHNAAPNPAKLLPAALMSRAGTYKSKAGDYQRLVVRGGTLVLASAGGLELVPESDSVFRYGSELTLSFTGSDVLVVKLLDRKPVQYSRIPAPEPEDPNQFAGSYYSPDLDAVWEFNVKNGQLVRSVKNGSTSPEPMVLVDRETFMSETGTVRFELRPAERAHAVVSAGRMRLEFVRTE